MGVYSNDRLGMSGAGIDTLVTANESYKGDVGLQQILIESAQNDMAIFDAIIRSDINEAVSLQEGTMLQEEVDVMHEGMVKDFFGKILAFLKKMLEKIKGIFKAIYAKISGVVVRDGKKLVDMHKKNVVGKNLSKMKYKWSKPTGHKIDASKLDIDHPLSQPLGGTLNSDDIDREVEEFSDDDALQSSFLGQSIGAKSSPSEDYAKDAHDYMFEEPSEEEGFSDIVGLMSTLMSMDKEIKDLKKMESDFERIINTAHKAYTRDSADAIRKASEKDQPSSMAKRHELDAKYANACYTYCSIAQSAYTKIIAAAIAAVKFHNAQCRAVWTKAAYFDPKSVKESAVLEETAYDAAFDEGCELFENFAY